MSYTVIQQHDSQHTHLEFEGLFNGKDVLWNTHFFTLNYYLSEKNIHSSKMKQFIDIKPTQTHVMNLTIALNIEAVTPPNIQKMMIMINQYKHLSLGRHEYG